MWFRNLLGWVLGLCILIPLGLYVIYWIFVGIYFLLKLLFSPIKIFFEKLEEDRIRKEEEKKENEYQDALARGDENAKVSKECYFLMKAAQERKAEEKKIQDKIEKYGFNISDEEVERIERIKKQKAEYEALPKKEKDRLAKKRKRDWIIIIVAFLSPYILFGLLLLIAKIIG